MRRSFLTRWLRMGRGNEQSGAKTAGIRYRRAEVWKYMDALPLNGTKDEGKI